MKPKAYSVLLVFVFTLIPLLAFSQETLTITTYYPSPYGSYRNLSIYRRLAIGNSATNWIDDTISGTTDGMQDSDTALFVPVYTGAETSDLRLYIVDNADDRFSIWGDSCGGGDCLDLNAASNIATFMGDGRVGIGTASPGARLHVIRPATNVVAVSSRTLGAGEDVFNQICIEGVQCTYWGLDSATNNTIFGPDYTNRDDLVITNTGNVGIGTPSPGSFRLYVNGSLHVESATTEKITNIVWTNPSDARLKNIIGSYKYGLAQILKINPVYYTYKENNALGIRDPGQHVGVIGQEVQQVIPEAITTGADGYLRFTADPIIWAAVNAIKEQQRQIDELKAEIKKIKSRQRE